jgi:hypothetical protein
MFQAIIAGTVLLLLFPIGTANAQGESKYKWEAGFQVTTIQLGTPAEKPIGLGGRIGRSLGNHITVEAEANHFPENPSRNFGETQVVGGIKAGGHVSSWGGFIKIRPGLLHFGGGDFRSRNSALAHPVLDIGAVAERRITETNGLSNGLWRYVDFLRRQPREYRSWDIPSRHRVEPSDQL